MKKNKKGVNKNLQPCTLKPVKRFAGDFRVRKDYKTLKEGQIIRLNFQSFTDNEKKYMVYSDSSCMYFFSTIEENEISNFFSENI
tara:strand:+ start:179 stop:433 length:255 start_codon:yes stop_codon:yes gene_type:complete